MTPHNLAMLRQACEAAGVQLGAYDSRILAWLAGWEPQTCAVIAALFIRAQAVGRARPPGSVLLTAIEAATARQALADASAWRAWRAEGAGCGECQRLDPGRWPCTPPTRRRPPRMTACCAAWPARTRWRCPQSTTDPAEYDNYTCSTCGAWIGMFTGRAGWQHYRRNPLEIYDAGHEATLAPRARRAGPVSRQGGQAPGVVEVRLSGAVEDTATVISVLERLAVGPPVTTVRLEILHRTAPRVNRRDPGEHTYILVRVLWDGGTAGER